MLGSIAGDIIGSIYEHRAIKVTEFPLFVKRSFFTDDTVLTIATADHLLSGKEYEVAYREWGRKYPDRGYGGTFQMWLSFLNM